MCRGMKSLGRFAFVRPQTRRIQDSAIGNRMVAAMIVMAVSLVIMPTMTMVVMTVFLPVRVLPMAV